MSQRAPVQEERNEKRRCRQGGESHDRRGRQSVGRNVKNREKREKRRTEKFLRIALALPATQKLLQNLQVARQQMACTSDWRHSLLMLSKFHQRAFRDAVLT
jgi:hypothetical protein